jgi:hypothetical protein
MLTELFPLKLAFRGLSDEDEEEITLDSPDVDDEEGDDDGDLDVGDDDAGDAANPNTDEE